MVKEGEGEKEEEEESIKMTIILAKLNGESDNIIGIFSQHDEADDIMSSYLRCLKTRMTAHFLGGGGLKKYGR